MDLAEIRSRINPQYADIPGTQSHERKWLCDRIAELEVETATLRAQLATLNDTIAAAQMAMAGAPIWSDGHRQAIAMLHEMRDAIAKMGGES